MADDRVLRSFGYRQKLRRALKLFSLFAAAFSFPATLRGRLHEGGAAIALLAHTALT